MSPVLSIVIPTRERSAYVTHAIRTCLAESGKDVEVVVLDNASVDRTRDAVHAIDDERVRYFRSDRRLSMRQNFERGFGVARGEIIGFIGDDDGVLPGACAAVIEHLASSDVGAVVGARAHYFWPDLHGPRENVGLLPRGSGSERLNSVRELRSVLRHADYYRVPCIYHGFVKRSVVDRVRERQAGIFFLSNNVDIFSAVALSMEDIGYVFSHEPLVINGASSRSNGAAHFQRDAAGEKVMWGKEDDLGFLPGFEGSISMASFIIESGLRYIEARTGMTLDDVFGEGEPSLALERERALRLSAGSADDHACAPMHTAGLLPRSTPLPPVSPPRALLSAFRRSMPIDGQRRGLRNVADAAVLMGEIRRAGKTGISDGLARQLATAVRLARRQR